jgi:hypothetical protein
MPKIYCSSCGNPIQYADVKPNFCTKCGCNLASGKVVQNQVKVEPEIEIIQKPSISSLNWDIEVTKPKGEKLKNLAKGEKSPAFQRDADESNLSKEEFLKQFQKEAGTLRRGSQAPDDDSADYAEDDDS